MIGTIDVSVQAENPCMPLHPMRSYVNSPSSIRIRNVPKRIGNWNITNVYFTVAYPDSSLKSVACVQVGNIWVGTIEGCAVVGTSENGYTIFASGYDENMQPVSGYVLGKGDVEILDADGTITPGSTTYYVHLYDEQPDEPKEGDMFPYNDGYVVWQNGEAHPLGLSVSQADERYLALNAPTNQMITQHPHFDSGMDITFDTTIFAPTKLYLETNTSLELASSWGDYSGSEFILHGATLSGGNSGVVATIGDVSAMMPSQTSDLLNDSGFITASAVASSYYNKSEIDGMIGSINSALDAINGEVI